MAHDVWLVVEEWGEWSDYTMRIDSAWDSEAGAVSHIVRDIGAEFDVRWRDRLSWRLEDDGPYDTYYSIRHMAVRHGD